MSTNEQGRSGLGLEAQQRDIDNFLAVYGGEVVESFEEVVSGKRNDRILFNKAIELTEVYGATVLVSKLDRLSRNVATITRLLETVNIRVATLPTADKFTLHIHATIAEDERNKISQRTKDALEALKAKGVKLGNPRLDEFRNTDNTKAVESVKYYADEFANHKGRRTLIEGMRNDGLSLRKIADRLNDLSIPTSRGGKWYPTSVKNLMARWSQAI